MSEPLIESEPAIWRWSVREFFRFCPAVALLAAACGDACQADGPRGRAAEQIGRAQYAQFVSALCTVRGQGTGPHVTLAFEKAAIEVGHMNGAKTVTINVGIIVNRGWQKLLETRGY
jgi:hypothetical protein